MAVDCNIVKKALNKVQLKIWGFEPDKSVDKAIATSYLEFLACDDISLKSCQEVGGNCADTVKNINCNINVRSISYDNPNDSAPDEINFLLGVTDIFNAVGPVTYLWSYDADVFEIIGQVTDAVVGFRFKTGSKPDLTVTGISVTITDANGCTDTKTCYYVGGQMKCAQSFVPCMNPVNLTVGMIYVPCVAPQSLVVTNFVGGGGGGE